MTIWRAAAVRVFGAERVDQLLALARRAADAIRAAARPLVDLARAAADVAAVVYVHRGRFRRRHLLAEARRDLAHQLRGQRAEPGLDERIVAAALAHCRALTTPAGPLAGEHTAYTLTLADQLPRHPPAGARITASRHQWARITSLRLQGITTGEPGEGRALAYEKRRSTASPPAAAAPRRRTAAACGRQRLSTPVATRSCDVRP